MAMTKKRYIAMAAKAIKRHVDYSKDPEVFLCSQERDQIYETAKGLASEMADIAKKDNPRFDRAKFMAACGLGE